MHRIGQFSFAGQRIGNDEWNKLKAKKNYIYYTDITSRFCDLMKTFPFAVNGIANSGQSVLKSFCVGVTGILPILAHLQNSLNNDSWHKNNGK